MKPAKKMKTLERRFSRLGVAVLRTVKTVDGYLVPDGFRCDRCGLEFFPDATRLRKRHWCPNGCVPKTK
jgi:hypothetical protein